MIKHNQQYIIFLSIPKQIWKPSSVEKKKMRLFKLNNRTTSFQLTIAMS